jgi:Domain of unknown function (DUF1902)
MVEAPITVNVAYDPEIDVWYVKASSLAGLNVEAKTVDNLIDKLPGAVTDILEESGRLDTKDISIDLVTRVRCRAAA